MQAGAFTIIVVYLAVVTAAGSLLARRAASSGGWAVAGGGMGLAMVAVGVAGTRIGGAGTYGVAERVMTGGLWYMWWYAINTFLAVLIVGLFFAHAYRRLGLRTVGEAFYERFGTRRCQALTSFCVQTEYIIVVVIEIYLIGAILTKVTGIGMGVAVAIAAAVLAVYVALGGLWGSAVSNLIHCGVILAGLLLVCILGTHELGGIAAVTAAVDGHLTAGGRDTGAFWSFAGAGLGPVIGMFFSAAIHTPAASVYTNFATAARSERILLPAFLFGGLIAALMPLFAGFVGLLTMAKYGLSLGLRGYQNLTQLAMDIHPLVGGVALAAILAAVISSGGPILLASATMFVNDWLSRLGGAFASPSVRQYRVTTVVTAALCAVVAFLIAKTHISLLDLLLFGFAMVVPPAVAIAFVLYDRRTTERGAYLGMLAGYIGGLAWFVAIKVALASGFAPGPDASLLSQTLHYLFVHDGRGTDPSYATTLIPLVLVPLVSRLSVPDDSPEGLSRTERFYSTVAQHPG